MHPIAWAVPSSFTPVDSQAGYDDHASAVTVGSSSPPAGVHLFRTGDSNRCRSVYEQVLRVELRANVLDAQKKNKHVSIGRCRMLAINHGVALPPYEALSRVSFVESGVPQDEWSVPTDCKRSERRTLTPTLTTDPSPSPNLSPSPDPDPNPDPNPNPYPSPGSRRAWQRRDRAAAGARPASPPCHPPAKAQSKTCSCSPRVTTGPGGRERGGQAAAAQGARHRHRTRGRSRRRCVRPSPNPGPSPNPNPNPEPNPNPSPILHPDPDPNQVRAAAEAEGLTLVPSSENKSGFKGVTASGFRFRAQLRLGSKSQVHQVLTLSLSLTLTLALTLARTRTRSRAKALIPTLTPTLNPTQTPDPHPGPRDVRHRHRGSAARRTLHGASRLRSGGRHRIGRGDRCRCKGGGGGGSGGA